MDFDRNSLDFERRVVFVAFPTLNESAGPLCGEVKQVICSAVISDLLNDHLVGLVGGFNADEGTHTLIIVIPEGEGNSGCGVIQTPPAFFASGVY